MLWVAVGVACSITAALTWWRTSRLTAAVTVGLLMTAGIVLAGMAGRSAAGDFTSGLMIGLPLLIVQAVHVDRADRTANSAR